MAEQLTGIEISEDRKTLTMHCGAAQYVFSVMPEAIEQLAATLSATVVSIKQEKAGGRNAQTSDPTWLHLPATHVYERIAVGTQSGPNGPELSLLFSYGSPFQTAYAFPVEVGLQLEADLRAEVQRIQSHEDATQH